MIELKKDPFWDCLVGANTFENYCQNIVPDCSFKKEVNEEVVKSFEIVKKLLIHAYFEYDFLDPAMAKALTSFEMALRHRYKEITGAEWTKSLQKLTYYFNDNGYFEVYRKDLLDALRSIRNSLAHPERSFGSGLGLMNVFTHCVNLINDTYGDVYLRQQRIEEKKKINDFLHRIIKHGALMTDRISTYIIYEAGIDFVNNLTISKKYFGHLKMIFPLKHEQDEQIKPAASLFFFEATSIEMDSINNSMKCKLSNNSFIAFTPITKEVNQIRFDKWISEFQSGQEDWVTDMEMNALIDKQWAKAREELHFSDSSLDTSERV